MGVLVRSLAIFFIGITISVSAAAQDDLEALRRRLADVEAEQAKSQALIEALRSEIEALGAKSKAERPAAPPAAESRDAVTDVPVVAETQASLPATPGKVRLSLFPELANESQFVLQSHDGNFKLAVDGTIIGRFEYNHRSDDGTGSSDDDWGFEMTGTRLNFRGILYKDYGYWVRFNADEFGADPFIDAAMGIYYINDDTTLVLGQFPSLLSREQGVPAPKLQVAESSPTNYTFDPFGFKGVMLGYHTPRLVFRGIINDGYLSISNAFFDDGPSADWAFAGQVVGMAVGDEDDFPRFDNFTSRPGSDFAWAINGASLVQGSPDIYLGIVESSMEGDGWNFYASGYYRHSDRDFDDIGGDDFGFVLLGGVWVAKHFELYSRFDMTIPDRDRPTEGDDFRTFTAGINFYPIPHTDNIKIGIEGLYMFDAEADSIVQPNLFSSVRASPDGGQVVIRTQAQIQW